MSNASTGNPSGSDFIAKRDDVLLVTGAAGFMGPRVVSALLGRGFRNLRCFIRPSSNDATLRELIAAEGNSARVEIIRGNLLSEDDCARAVNGVSVVYHLAAGRGEKSFADAFLNSVVTTRNLLESLRRETRLLRFVSISSFSVYSNRDKRTGELLDETCELEERPEARGDPYCFAKTKQDNLILKYHDEYGIPFVILRPGVVYGAGNATISGRVGIGTFGVFLQFGGSTPLPLSYVDNCAEAIALAGLHAGVDGEVFNVVDDELPSSAAFLDLYKKKVKRFPSLTVPRLGSYLFCYAWEKYSAWSGGQLPPTYNRLTWHAYWKRSSYTNRKLKERLGWSQKVSTAEGLERFFESCRERHVNA